MTEAADRQGRVGIGPGRDPDVPQNGNIPMQQSDKGRSSREEDGERRGGGGDEDNEGRSGSAEEDERRGGHENELRGCCEGKY